jgi:AcrR family transcriptional regulator
MGGLSSIGIPVDLALMGVILYNSVIINNAVMTPSDRRAKAKAELRQRILDAARSLFVKEGYEAVTMRAIARKIGYTTMALYYQFPDKEALLRELCRHDFLALSARFNRLGRLADPVERIRRLGQVYVSFGLKYPQHYRLMFLSRHPEPSPETMDIEKGNPQQDAYAFLLQAVREAMAAGRFRADLTDAALLAQVLWASVHGLVSLHLNKDEGQWVDWRPAAKAVHLITGASLDGLLR